MKSIIKTEELSINDLPRKYAAWNKIIEFASSFDIKKELESSSNISGVNDINESSTIKEIRISLYNEWRRYNHRCTDPEPEVEKKVWSVIELLRNKISNVT